MAGATRPVMLKVRCPSCHAPSMVWSEIILGRENSVVVNVKEVVPFERGLEKHHAVLNRHSLVVQAEEV